VVTSASSVEERPESEGSASAGQAGVRPPLRRRLHTAFREEIGSTERPLLIAWTGFAVTFGVTRAVTAWIHAGHGPSDGGMTAGGTHLHHYNIGIALLGAVGGVALRGQEHHRRHPVTAAAYGSGAALIIDEAALLIELEDVYWANEGRRSVMRDAVVSVERDAHIAAVAYLMRRAGETALVVVNDSEHRSPLAVITDTDVAQVIATASIRMRCASATWSHTTRSASPQRRRSCGPRR
jgi:hypothetical protein